MSDQEFSLSLLTQAAKTLNEAIVAVPRNDFVRDAIIQRFEYTYELSWKTLRRYFKENQNADEFHIKNIWREAAKHGLIDESECWFEFHKARNRTSHTYSRKVADQVIAEAIKFNAEVSKLIARLESKIAS